jgi:hypothetical protein
MLMLEKKIECWQTTPERQMYCMAEKPFKCRIVAMVIQQLLLPVTLHCVTNHPETSDGLNSNDVLPVIQAVLKILVW